MEVLGGLGILIVLFEVGILAIVWMIAKVIMSIFSGGKRR